MVGKVIDGDTESLKERTIAVEVFGRKASADLDHDSIVRVGAREVRKRLTEYYAAEGANSTLRIELPTGSYLPLFHPRVERAEAVPVRAPAIRSRRRRLREALCGAVGRQQRQWRG